MSYKGLSDMRRSPSPQERIVACAAQEGIADPDAWTVANSWAIVARSDWIAAWDYAVETYTPDKNPDIGARPDVISDGWILTAVQDVNTP